jgi:hypothetical protein
VVDSFQVQPFIGCVTVRYLVQKIFRRRVSASSRKRQKFCDQECRPFKGCQSRTAPIAKGRIEKRYAGATCLRAPPGTFWLHQFSPNGQKWPPGPSPTTTSGNQYHPDPRGDRLEIRVSMAAPLPTEVSFNRHAEDRSQKLNALYCAFRAATPDRR